MKQKLIVIDSKTYTSINEMPPDVRAAYEQVMGYFKGINREGITDLVENVKPTVATSAMKFIVDGREYKSARVATRSARIIRKSNGSIGQKS